MKLSILLPTRDRLEYLRYAVQSVLRQDYGDWELVISDNCSQGDVEGHLASIADARISYERTERVLPVTENWNRALARSSGDYVLMLGDDDALLAGYMTRMAELVRRFAQPELIYTKALLFTYPGVDPAHPGGFQMEHGCAEFFAGAPDPFILSREQATGVVKAAMGFKLRYDFNAQFALISRRLIDRMRRYGPFYQSDFPDFYSMNGAFLCAQKIVVDPSPRVVIGVTPKSYGFFHLNHREEEGRSFLSGAQAGAAAGTNINVGWLSAVTALEAGMGQELGLRASRRRYRFYQAAHVYSNRRNGSASDEEVESLKRGLPIHERWFYRSADGFLGVLDRVLPARLRQARGNLAARVTSQIPDLNPQLLEKGYRNVLELLDDREASDLTNTQV